MTATRWWVKGAARWFARLDGVSKHLQLAMLGLTGVSTMSIGLQDYGLERFTGPIILALAVVGLLFTYYYTEGGVWNQVNRDRNDLSDNYADPRGRINTELTSRALYAALEGRELTDAERKHIKAELDDAFSEYRDGIDVAAREQKGAE